MTGATRCYATARPFCGHHAQPGVTQVPGALDWSQQETTPDQACIEAVLETLLVPGASMLHGGSAIPSSPNALPGGRAASMA